METFRQNVLRCLHEINKRIEHTTKACEGVCDEDITEVMKNFPDLKFDLIYEDDFNYHFKIPRLFLESGPFTAVATTWKSSNREIYYENFDKYLWEGYLYDGIPDDKTIFFKLRFFLENIRFEEDLTTLQIAPP